MKQLRMWFSGALLLAIGCVDVEGPVPAPVTAADVFAEFRFTTDAMLIKPGDTLQLSLVATSMDGSPITVDPRQVQWQLADSIRLNVDSVGRITAKMLVPNSVDVTAVYTHGTTTRRALMAVYVTEDDVSANSLKMVALDSTRVGAFAGTLLPRVRLDLYQGTTLVRAGMQLPVAVPTPYVANYLPTGGPAQEPVYTVANLGTGLGKFWVRSSINLYGTEVRDSLEFTGTYPFTAGAGFGIGALAAFQLDKDGNLIGSVAKRIMQQPCGLVRVLNFSTRALELAFSDSLAAADECAPVSPAVQSVFGFPGIGWVDVVGGNLVVPPFSIAIRRSATRGDIDWFLRDPTTKERLQFSGQYSSIYVE